MSGSFNVETIAAGFRWDGGSSSDPIKDLHALIERTPIFVDPAPILLPMWLFQRLELVRLLMEMAPKPSYRVRTTAVSILRFAERRRGTRSRRYPWEAIGPAATAEDALARALALEVQ